MLAVFVDVFDIFGLHRHADDNKYTKVLKNPPPSQIPPQLIFGGFHVIRGGSLRVASILNPSGREWALTIYIRLGE
jgi:hypothetical protein